MTCQGIVHVANAPGLGGVTEVVYQLLRHLPRDRFAPHLYFLKGVEAHDEDRSGQFARFAELGVEIASPPAGSGKMEVIADLAQYLEQRNIALLHTHSYRPNLYGRIAGALQRSRGLKILSHYHNHYDDKWSEGSAALTLERTLATSTDGMIAVSRQVRDHVAEAIRIDVDRIEVVENGADLVRFSPRDAGPARRVLGLDANAFTIGLIGRVCRQKAQDDLVEAATIVNLRFPDVRFVLFGDIEDKALHQRLMQRIEDAGLANAVTFTGHISDVPAAYAACDIIVVPSRWEGFPLVIAEAMASRKPIIATTVSAIPEMVGRGEAAVLVPPRAPDKLAGAIARLIGDAKLRHALAARAHEMSSRFSWQQAAAQVAGIYDSLLAQPVSRKRDHDAHLTHPAC